MTLLMSPERSVCPEPVCASAPFDSAPFCERCAVVIVRPFPLAAEPRSSPTAASLGRFLTSRGRAHTRSAARRASIADMTDEPATAGDAPVAFVLGGGGVLGAAEVGMARALTEAGIRPDLVLGTSI